MPATADSNSPANNAPGFGDGESGTGLTLGDAGTAQPGLTAREMARCTVGR